MRFTVAILETVSLIFVVTFLVCCEDNVPLSLPAKTSIGAGTFGCLIDGRVYVPTGSKSAPSIDITAANMIVVYGSMEDIHFSIKVRDTVNAISKNKRYLFEDQKEVSCKYQNWQDKNNDCTYDELPVSGFVEFTEIDYAKHIMSGVFEFTAFSSVCNRTVTITQGRFDIRTDL